MVEHNSHVMRRPCSCGCISGRIEDRGGQDCVFCEQCGRWQYNAPRTETGRAVRTVSTTHAGIKPKQRFRIIQRDGGKCRTCGRHSDGLHIGHVLSVKDGHECGFTDEQLNSDANLIAQCSECNLGQGRRSLPLWLAVGLLRSGITEAERCATWDEVLT